MTPKVLEGIKVADFTWFIAGPLTTKSLSDFGAEVIKIEGRSRPDQHRKGSPFKKTAAEGLDRCGMFNRENTGKLSVALNLGVPRGRELAGRFVSWADVVVENFAGGAMARMGLGYDELKKIKPDLIMLSSSMQGQTGPHFSHPGLGHHLSGLSGITQITGWPDRDPVNPGPYTDFIAPVLNAFAIVAALDYRRRTGKGQYIDMSQCEASLQFMAPILLDYTVNRRTVSRMGNRCEHAAPHAAYRCRGEDRWCAIAVFSEEEWKSFCRVIGSPAWTGDPRFAALRARKENEEELDRRVEEWTISRTAEEVMSLMQAAGVPAGVLQTGEDLLERDPQLEHRRFFRSFEHPVTGRGRAWRTAFILSEAEPEVRRAPLLGEHNDYAFRQILGMSGEEIAALVKEGVIE